jgi:hypothetical protein
MKVYPNPYGQLDHTGRLAGACPMEPSHRAGARSFVCAELVSLNGEDLQKDKSLSQEQRDARERHSFVFSAEPISIAADPGWYYANRARSGEVFMPRDHKPPMAQWAAARATAIAEWQAQHNNAPDFTKWAEQWPLDAQVAAFKEKGGSR